MAVGHLCLVFCTPELSTLSLVLYIAYNLCYAFSIAGTNSSLTTLCFDYVEHEDRRYILGVKSSISGIAAFLTSLLWGAIVSFIQDNGNTLFGMKIYPQQVLSRISVIIVVVLLIFVLPTLKKDKK